MGEGLLYDTGALGATTQTITPPIRVGQYENVNMFLLNIIKMIYIYRLNNNTSLNDLRSTNN